MRSTLSHDRSPHSWFILGCAVGILALLTSALSAQPIQLLERGAPGIERLRDASGGYLVPDGDWSEYRAWLQKGLSPSRMVSVAIIDSGVLGSHPFIRPILRKAIDLTGEGPEDRIGHGTVVALLFLRSGSETPRKMRRTQGVNEWEYWPPSLISIKVFSEAGMTGSETMVKALQVAGEELASADLAVVSVSAGVYLECANARDPSPHPYLMPCEDTPICRAVRDLQQSKGILVSAAVGNTPGKTACPACCRGAMAVGASDEKGQTAPYSGAFADILARGRVQLVPIQSTRP